MKRVILVIGTAGFLLFGAAFLLSFLGPRLVESALTRVVLIEVEREAGAHVDAVLDARLARLARQALGKTNAQIDYSRRALRARVSREAVEVVAAMGQPDCECRLRLATAVRVFEQQRIASLSQLRDRLSGLVESAYAKVAENLLREFRIFTGTNAIAFALLACAAAFRGQAARQLLLPAIALLCTLTVMGSLYLFGQDWLHAIIFNDYVGLAYILYLAAVALLILDVLVNRARVTTRMVSAGLAAVGAAFAVAPC